jgi:colanic acid biosynthesis glycosyl transferase WcaI
MRILIVTPYFTPDLGPSAPMFDLLSRALIKLGHNVTVIAMVPHFPSGVVKAGFRNIRIKTSIHEGVKIIRIPVPSLNRENLSKRMLQFAFYQLGASISGILQSFDVAIISNPFFCALLPLLSVAKLRRKPTIYSVFDVYPYVGIKLGVFKNKYIISTASILERFCLTNSSIVQLLSGSFTSIIESMEVPESKISLVYPWVDTDLIQPESPDNKFVQQNNLAGNFIVLYAGNLGLSQGLENIVSAASLLTAHQDIKFVFVGDGIGKETLQYQANQLHLNNIRFLPFQPRERLSEVLASADISIVILKKGIGSASLPSKIFSIMASGRPILISVEEDSEAWELIRNAGAGIWSPPEDPGALAKTILTLKKEDSQRKQLGKNGRAWVERHHSPEVAAEQFEKLLVRAINLHQ